LVVSENSQTSVTRTAYTLTSSRIYTFILTWLRCIIQYPWEIGIWCTDHISQPSMTNDLEHVIYCGNIPIMPNWLCILLYWGSFILEK